jgi:ketosteroid isomerase-like protein
MSPEIEGFVRRGYAVLNERDYSRIPEFLDPDVEIDVSRNALNPGIHLGYAEFEQMLRATDDVWDGFHNEVHDVVEVGDRVVVSITNTATGKGSGVTTRMDLFHVLTLRDGRIVRIVGGLETKEAALEEAGRAE